MASFINSAQGGNSEALPSMAPSHASPKQGMLGGASLVTSHKTSRETSPKQGRAFHRILSGINHHLSQNHRVRILTLTSRPGIEQPYQDLTKAWQALRKRICRAFGGPLDYWRLRTFEGQGAGVLHILYVGPYVPQSWLSHAWGDLWNAPIVYIQELKTRYGSKRIASYMVANYMGHHEVSRQSWSWGWVFRGFVGYWHRLIKLRLFDFPETIRRWTYIMKHQDPRLRLDILFGDYWKQVRFKKRVECDPSPIVLGL